MQSDAGFEQITSLVEEGEALSLAGDCSTARQKFSPGWSSDVSPPDQPAKWFAAYTTPRHEKVVARHLQSRHIESFLPLYSSVRRWKNGCRVAVEQPLFPSYLFVHILRREAVKVLQIPGVVSLVSAGREPAALPSSEIESLRSSLPLRHFEPHPYLVVGEKVRITAGSLEGMIGVLVRRKNDCRVVLTLELIMQSVAVEIGIEEIEPVKQ
ncbi:MAG: UpxY family transcription antiterminator [Candidatus Korobacteraceae bacterium]